IADYAKDWGRIVNLNFAGYPAVISAARSGASWAEITKKFNQSQYAEQDYNINTILNRASDVNALFGGGSAPISGGDTGDVATGDFSQAQLVAIGPAAVALIALVARR